MNEKSRSIELAANLLSLVLIVTILYYLQSVIVPLLLHILSAISLFPIGRQLENWRLTKVAAAIISVSITIAVIAGLNCFIINQVIIIGPTDLNLHDKFLVIVDSI